MPAPGLSTPVRVLVTSGTVLAVAGTVHELVNRSVLRRPPEAPPAVRLPVSLLVPARDEARRIAPTVRSLLAQRGLADVEILVLDDGSTDGTADVVTRAADGDPRLRVLRGAPPPPGSLGKPHACAQLAAAARGEVLVFVDADVVLAPHAVAAAVAVLRGPEPLALLCPWPRQLVDGAPARLVQPLLAWSWLTTVPLRVAERSGRPSMALANGQFLLVEAAALARAGGWQAVRGAVLDDLALARAVRRSGGRTGVADGSGLADLPDVRLGPRPARGLPQVAVGGVRLPGGRRRGRGGARPGLRAAARRGTRRFPHRCGRVCGGGGRTGARGPLRRIRQRSGRGRLGRPGAPALDPGRPRAAGVLVRRPRPRLPAMEGTGGVSRVVVIGAGLGGLATAARLAAAGHEVEVHEAADTAGGKLGVVERDGFTFDTGPSLLTMPGLLDELFAATGGPADLPVEPVDPACEYRFADGTHLALPHDPAHVPAALDAALGAGAGAAWDRLHARSRHLWDRSSGATCSAARSPRPRCCA